MASHGHVDQCWQICNTSNPVMHSSDRKHVFAAQLLLLLHTMHSAQPFFSHCLALPPRARPPWEEGQDNGSKELKSLDYLVSSVDTVWQRNAMVTGLQTKSLQFHNHDQQGNVGLKLMLRLDRCCC